MTIGLLDRYLWRQLGELFAFGVTIFTLLLLVNHLFLVARLVLQQRAPVSVSLHLLDHHLLYLLALRFPITLLLTLLLAIEHISSGTDITTTRPSVNIMER